MFVTNVTAPVAYHCSDFAGYFGCVGSVVSFHGDVTETITCSVSMFHQSVDSAPVPTRMSTRPASSVTALTFLDEF